MLFLCVLIIAVAMSERGKRRKRGQMVAFILALPALASLTWKGYRGVRRVSVFPYGILFRRGWGEKRYLWAQVKELTRQEARVKGTRVAWLKVLFDDGTRARLDQSLSDYDRLAEAIEQHATPILLAQARKGLAFGKVTFGPVTLTPQEVAIRFWTGRRWSRPWKEVANWSVVNGRLSFTARDGGQAHYPLGWVPNNVVLLQLLPARLQIRQGPRG